METVLIIQPFRKPKCKDMIVSNYPYWEVINVEPLTMAAVIENAGYNVHFLAMQNMFKSFSTEKKEKLEHVLENINPDVLIFATDYYMANGSTAMFYCANLIIDYYKKGNQLKKIILTGRNAFSLGKKNFTLLNDLNIVVKGECENIICDLIKKDINELRDVKGIIYRDECEIVENTGFWTIEDWNNIPLPGFHLLKESIAYIEELNGIKMKNLPITLRTSFGCVNNCNYCAGTENWKKYHLKPSEYVRKEIELAYSLFPEIMQLYFIADEIFTIDINHVRTIVDILCDRNIKVTGLFAHTKYFNDEVAENIKKITDTVLFGAENCCDNILSIANKGQTFEELLSSIEIAKKHKLKVSLEWIVGLPGETIETAIINLNKIYMLIAKGIVDHINTYVFCPHPNTEFVNNSEKYKIMVDDTYDDMLEEGGYPCVKLEKMSKNQVFIYYLLSQLIINDAHQIQGSLPENYNIEEYNLEMFKELFEKIGDS